MTKLISEATLRPIFFLGLSPSQGNVVCFFGITCRKAMRNDENT